jgi:hypothetical protein
MRRTNSLLVILALFAAAQIATFNVRASRVQETSTLQEPQVTGVRLSGKKLFVIGENFSEGAIIWVNGVDVGTRNDPDNPAGMLIAKKGGKRIPPDTVASIAVQNVDGTKSQDFELFSGLTITLDDARKTFNLKVGEKFLLLLKKDTIEWSVSFTDSSLIVRLAEEPAVPGAQGIFQAVRAGTTQLSAIGEYPCAKLRPACLQPALAFEAGFIVE